MSTVIPQSELTKRALDWIQEKRCAASPPVPAAPFIEEAAMRFNLGPLEVEFLERFFAQQTKDEC